MPYLNREQILTLIINKQIYSERSTIIDQIQPASLDLTLSKVIDPGLPTRYL